jgi:hypothetical protein
MYVGRGLVYEDCRRSGALTLGKDFLDRIGPPLSIALDGMRWTASELANAVRQYLRHRHAKLRAACAGESVDSLLFYNDVRQTSTAALAGAFRQAGERIDHAWREVLGGDLGTGRVVRTAQEVRHRADAIFRPVGRLWGRAHHMSPDIMVAAPSVNAFRRGGFHAVLGGLHSTNTLVRSSLVTQHPDRQVLVNAFVRDVGGARSCTASSPRMHSSHVALRGCMPRHTGSFNISTICPT